MKIQSKTCKKDRNYVTMMRNGCKSYAAVEKTQVAITNATRTWINRELACLIGTTPALVEKDDRKKVSTYLRAFAFAAIAFAAAALFGTSTSPVETIVAGGIAALCALWLAILLIVTTVRYARS